MALEGVGLGGSDVRACRVHAVGPSITSGHAWASAGTYIDGPTMQAALQLPCKTGQGEQHRRPDHGS